MAARKLQLEIDRTLKKVAEGVEVFESIWDKMQSTAHQAQKEKLEQDLKTQIKKLQRLRDQIKTWLQSNEIKDKTSLTDNRRLIETQMERFKACEKEMKTKAFSKEGLSAAAKLDPKEQLKIEMASWVSNMVDELGRQVEMTEAELETLAGSTKKKSGKNGMGRASELDHLNERRKWHVNRLELILRLLENGNLEPDSLSTVKEDIAYFVESNTEEDFEEDEGIYDELNLAEEEETFGMANDDLQSSLDSHSIADASDIVINATPLKPAVRKGTGDDSSNNAGDKSPTTRKDSVGEKPKQQRKATLEGASRPQIATSTSPPVPKLPTSIAAAPQPRTTPVVLPPIRYSAAAASAVTSQPPPTTTSEPAKDKPVSAVALPSLSAAQPPPKATPAISSPPLANATLNQPSISRAISEDVSDQVLKDGIISATASGQTHSSSTPSPALSHAQLPASATEKSGPFSPAASSASIALSSQQAAASGDSPERQTSALPSLTPQMQPNRPPSAASSVPSQSIPKDQVAPQPSQLQQQAGQSLPANPSMISEQSTKLPNSLTDLVTAFENAKQKSIKREGDTEAVNKILEAGFTNTPQAADAERPKYYVPKNPYHTPFHYPQQPLAILESPALFSKYDVDTLFYIFYYRVGTYMQYLAAEELKKRAWRFHKQYLTWFQRANEPQVINEDHEQGVYLYFDWETDWRQRTKSPFTFYYRYLEDGD